jgi:REP element-mobilizing transposase RayT
MARKPRCNNISANEITIAHVWTQTVQQMFLLGNDSCTNQDYSHRKDWIIDIMSHQSMFMAIDILRFAIMDNHVHFLLRTRPDVVQSWSDEEVAWSYLSLCPKYKRRRKVNGKWEYEAQEPSECDIRDLVNDQKKLKKVREKLSSLSFWMQLLKQRVAKRANAEVQDGEVCKGAFWKGRFEMTVINTRAHMLTCSVYIDLNAYRARMTDSLMGYQYTSIYMQLKEALNAMLLSGDLVATQEHPMGAFPESGMLSPIEFREIGSEGLSSLEAESSAVQTVESEGFEARKRARRKRLRCSDTGFLEITSKQYCELVEWSKEQLGAQRRGVVSGLEHAVVSSYGMSSAVWNDRLLHFRKMYREEAGASRRKLMEGFCGEVTAAMYLALSDTEFKRQGLVDGEGNLG